MKQTETETCEGCGATPATRFDHPILGGTLCASCQAEREQYLQAHRALHDQLTAWRVAMLDHGMNPRTLDVLIEDYPQDVDLFR